MSEPFVLLLVVIFGFTMVATVGVVIVLVQGGSFSGRIKVKPHDMSADIEAQNRNRSIPLTRISIESSKNAVLAQEIATMPKTEKTRRPPARKSAA